MKTAALNSCFQEEATESESKFDSEKQKMTGEIAQMHRSLEKEKGLMNYMLCCLLSVLTVHLVCIVHLDW